jgi:DNA-directed RNA polymerase alpha subunit
MSEGKNFEHIPLLPELRYDLERVNFSTRFHNVLRSKKNIKTVADLLNISFEDLIKFRNCGEATINEVRNQLRRMLRETTD